MREFSKIKCTIWASEKFTKLSDKHKLFYLHLHTNTRVNSCGCYYNPPGYSMVDMGWSEDEIKAAIDACVDTLLIQYSYPTDTVFIEQFFMVNSPQNPKHAIKLLSDIEMIPYQGFQKLCAAELKRFVEHSGWKIEKDFLYRIDRVCTTKTKTETETETETVKKNKQKKISSDDDEKVFEDAEPVTATEIQFNQFWELYPRDRRGSKQKALEAYRRVLKEKRATHEEIYNGVENYRGSSEATDYPKGCAAWLNDERWQVDYRGADQKRAATKNGGSVSNALKSGTRKAAQSLFDQGEL